MVKLYQFPVSPYCEKTVRALNVKGIPFEPVIIKNTEREKNLGFSPTHKFPVLELDDGTRIVDSTDIGWWLEEHYPNPPLIPKDPAERGRMHIIEDWADESLFPYDLYIRATWPHNVPLLIADVFGHETPEVQAAMAEQVPVGVKQAMVAQGLGRKSRQAILDDLARHFDSLEGILSKQDWLVSSHMTLADIGVFCMAWVLQRAEEGAYLLEARPALSAWRARMEDATGPGSPFPVPQDTVIRQIRSMPEE